MQGTRLSLGRCTPSLQHLSVAAVADRASHPRGAARPSRCDVRAEAVAEPQTEQPSINPYTDLVQGKKFTCTECGKCCTGAGEVWMNKQEYTAAAKFLGLEVKFFLKTYCKDYSRRPGWRMLKRQHRLPDCIFLKNDRCSIYGARPLQCQTYPWWPELMSDRSWVAEAGAVCEGINHATATATDLEGAALLLQAQVEHEIIFGDGRAMGGWNL